MNNPFTGNPFSNPFRSSLGNPLAGLLLSNRFINFSDRKHWSADFGRFAVERWCWQERRCPDCRHPLTLTVWTRPRHPKG